ncbi:hypothetical protein EWH99_00360 [Sporolactobacillus sp. THM7-7]|nr:hypothetical protein EWH99_00360 [Sporolactobacillus sp. THM7-7]
MTPLWLTFHFILIILAFYLILHLYQRIRVLEASDPEKNRREIEEVMSGYLNEIREENDRLAEKVKEREDGGTSRWSGDRQRDRDAREEPAEEDKAGVKSRTAPQDQDGAFEKALKKKLTEPFLQGKKQKGKKTSEASDPKDARTWVPPVPEVHDTFEASLAARAMNLHKKGYTVTEISRQLKRGKGEIELLLKFQGKVRS